MKNPRKFPLGREHFSGYSVNAHEFSRQGRDDLLVNSETSKPKWNLLYNRNFQLGSGQDNGSGPDANFS